MPRWMGGDGPGGSERSWPTPGQPTTFRCMACEGFLDVIYSPGAPMTCVGCGTKMVMPPLPEWYAGPSVA